MKIYTKEGDKGETTVFDKKCNKNSLEVEAIGAIDELNSQIGLARSLLNGEVDPMLEKIQNDLFILGAELAGSSEIKITEEHVKHLENAIDRVSEQLKPLKKFVIPSGKGASLHVARSVCRRAERNIVSLSKERELNPHVLEYTNRLSDLLFVLARWTNQLAGIDKVWKK